jgi:N-acetylglucosamine repressor
MSDLSIVRPALLSKINERKVLRTIQARGPMSRADVARHAGVTPPTASKAVESLLRASLLEEEDVPEVTLGRPARRLRLASQTTQVLGLVIDAGQCRVLATGLDGKPRPDRTFPFSTPDTYEQLIAEAASCASRLMQRPGVATHGLGISMPGLIDQRQHRGLLSPNVPITNGRSPDRDLEAQLGIECIMVQEEHALCLAERTFGAARGLDDFAMLDISTGVGLGVMSGGRLLTGHSGLAGEIGHITVDIDGQRCGCGNHGCLETVASDSALARAISLRLGQRVTIEQVIELTQRGEISPAAELNTLCRYLAVGLAAVINLFNPSSLFIHGALFALDSDLLARLSAETQRRALPPSFADCRIVQARGSKRQGAIAAIIEHLFESVVPERSIT